MKTSEALSSIITEITTAFDHKPKYLFSDNGREFIGQEVKQLLDRHSILKVDSVPHISQTHRRIERYVHTAKILIRSLLVHSHLHAPFGDFSCGHAEFLYNSTRIKTINEKYITPYIIAHKKAAEFTRLHTFGCDVIYNDPRPGASIPG